MDILDYKCLDYRQAIKRVIDFQRQPGDFRCGIIVCDPAADRQILHDITTSMPEGSFFIVGTADPGNGDDSITTIPVSELQAPIEQMCFVTRQCVDDSFLRLMNENLDGFTRLFSATSPILFMDNNTYLDFALESQALKAVAQTFFFLCF